MKVEYSIKLSDRLRETIRYAKVVYASLSMTILTIDINADLCPEYERSE